MASYSTNNEKVKEERAGDVLEKAKEAVLVESISLPRSTPTVKGIIMIPLS